MNDCNMDLTSLEGENIHCPNFLIIFGDNPSSCILDSYIWFCSKISMNPLFPCSRRNLVSSYSELMSWHRRRSGTSLTLSESKSMIKRGDKVREKKRNENLITLSALTPHP